MVRVGWWCPVQLLLSACLIVLQTACNDQNEQVLDCLCFVLTLHSLCGCGFDLVQHFGGDYVSNLCIVHSLSLLSL